MFLLKRLSPHTLFSRTSPYSIFTALCSTSSRSHLTYSHPHSRNVGVSVWWDLECCTVPSGVSVFRGAQAITAAIESTGIKGPIKIKAFGDVLRIARTNPEASSSTAINFTLFHTPYGDRFPSMLLHQLRMENFNVLLASKESVRPVLKSAATVWWNWDVLVRGENLTERLYNQPPEESWYGQYEGPIEDPFETL